MSSGNGSRWSTPIAIKPGHAPRLIYRVHNKPRRSSDKRKGFTETGYARLFDAAHQQLTGPLVVVWDLARPGTTSELAWHHRKQQRGPLDDR